MNILIYPYGPFSLYDGGMVALHQLAKMLDDAGVMVRIYGHVGSLANPIFSKYYNNEFNIQDSIVIYTEAARGNPLKANKVVRWMLSELGRIVPKHYAKTWGNNDLVYYFNFSKNRFYKPLTSLYLSPEFKDLGLNRAGICYTLRKGDPSFQGWEGKEIIGPYFMPDVSTNLAIQKDWHEITRETAKVQVQVFNTHEYFISYDPLTFMSFIAALCGCVSVVNICKNMTKIDWLKNTCFWPYMCHKKLTNINGIAYGMGDVDHAISTKGLLQDQLLDFNQFCKDEMIPSFIADCHQYSGLPNTVGRMFYPSLL